MSNWQSAKRNAIPLIYEKGGEREREREAEWDWGRNKSEAEIKIKFMLNAIENPVHSILVIMCALARARLIFER